MELNEEQAVESQSNADSNRVSTDESGLHTLFTLTTSSSTSSGIYCDEINNNESNNHAKLHMDLIPDECSLIKRVSFLRQTAYPHKSDLIAEPLNNNSNESNQNNNINNSINIVLTIPSSSSITSDVSTTNDVINSSKKKHKHVDNDDTDLDVSENLSNVDLVSSKDKYFNNVSNKQYFLLHSPKQQDVATTVVDKHKKSKIKVFICKPNSYEKRSNKKSLKNFLKLKNNCNRKQVFNLINKNFKSKSNDSNLMANLLINLINISKNKSSNRKKSFNNVNIDKFVFNVILFLLNLCSNTSNNNDNNTKDASSRNRKKIKNNRTKNNAILKSLSLSTTATSAMIESVSSINENEIEDYVIQDMNRIKEQEEELTNEKEEVAVLFHNKHTAPSISRLNSVCSSTNQNLLKIPANIDDPCLFIDNLYNQLLNQPNPLANNNEKLFDLVDLNSPSQSTSNSSVLNDNQKNRLKKMMEFANLINKTQIYSTGDANKFNNDLDVDEEVDEIINSKDINNNSIFINETLNDQIYFDDNFNYNDWNFKNQLNEELENEPLIKSCVNKCDLWMNAHFDANKFDKISNSSRSSPKIQWNSSNSTSNSSLVSRNNGDLVVEEKSQDISHSTSPYHIIQNFNYNQTVSAFDLLYINSRNFSVKNNSCPNFFDSKYEFDHKKEPILTSTTPTRGNESAKILNIFKRVLTLPKQAHENNSNDLTASSSSTNLQGNNYFALFFDSLIKSLKFIIVTKNVFLLPILICLLNSLKQPTSSNSLVISETTANTILSITKSAGSMTAKGLLLCYKK